VSKGQFNILEIEKRRILEMHNFKGSYISEEKKPTFLVLEQEEENPVTTNTTSIPPEVNLNSNNEDLPTLDPLKPEKIDVTLPSPEIVEIGKQYLGKPYVYGAQGPNKFDCSGYVRYLLSKTGLLTDINDTSKLPRTASGMYSSPSLTKVNMEEIKPGDLVFFKSGSKISHVGLISKVDQDEKNEKIFHMLHASSSSGTQDTEQTQYTKKGVNKTPYWAPKIAGFGRV
jgi:cell wall-associated NlpC family hydrolase